MASFRGFCDDAGRFSLDDKAGFLAYIAAKFKGQEVLIEPRKVTRRQGTQSLRYLRGVIIPDIAKACGYSDPDDYESVWQGIAWKFLRLPDGPFGEPRRRSTAKNAMSQDELTALIDEIITYAESSIPDCRIRRPEEMDMDRVVDQEYE